jgi:hypothetical protein
VLQKRDARIGGYYVSYVQAWQARSPVYIRQPCGIGAGLCLKVAGDPVRTFLAEAVPGSVPPEIGYDQLIVGIDVLNQVVPDLGMVLVGYD